jgi:exopolysaccharide production protein ExoQ
MTPFPATQAAKRIHWAEYAAAAATLFMFAEAFLPRWLAPGATDVTGEIPESTLLRYLWLPFYAIVGLGLVAAGKDAWRALASAPLLILLAILAMTSSLWSLDPDLSFRRGIAVLATTLLGVYLAARFDWLAALRLVAFVWLTLMVASLIAGVLFPGFGRMQEIHPGAWSGGWWEKNQLGGHAARSAFLFAFLAWRDRGLRRTWIIATLTAAALAVLSTSATALLGVVLGFGVLASAWWMVKGRTWSLVLVWIGLSVVGIAALIYAVAPGMLLGLIGREPTLTGRTDIWVELVVAISEKPVFGHGYLAFWAPDSEPRYWLAKALDWNAPSGHNGWLDLAISLGLIGIIVYAIDAATAAVRAARLAVASPAGVFAIGFLAQFMLFAMSESIILAQNSILWAMYVFVSCKLAMEARKTAAVPAPFPEARSIHHAG